MARFFLLIFVGLLGGKVLGQSTQEQLAGQYFKEGEFEKAEVLYQKLLSDNPASGFFYQQLLTCLIQQKKFEEGLRIIKKTGKRNGDKPLYYVDICWMYGLQGDKTRQERTGQDVIKQLKQDDYIIRQTSDWCQFRRLYELSKEVLIRGRMLMGQPELYRLEMGDLYRKMGKIPEMMDEYLNGVNAGSLLTDELEQRLSSSMEDSLISLKIGNVLLERVRKNPESDGLTELLTWFYIQQKNFQAAFIQRKAKDKKQKTEGGPVLELAHTAFENGATSEARAMVAYVTLIGEAGRWYEEARSLELEILKKIVLQSVYQQADLNSLTQACKEFLQRRGITNQTSKVVKDLADLEANYLHQTDSAILRLEQLVDNSRIFPQTRAECKLILGDLYLQTGDFYTPVLLYGQVDTDFKEEALGREAKFRNARLSYFKGEFEWSKAQLDVLKTATSQLISNDAIALSLKIQENTGEDSTESAMKLFADAELLTFQKKFDTAWVILDTILARFPDHPLTDNIWMTKAEIRKEQRNWKQALIYYEEVYSKFSQDVLADNAIMSAAEIQENNLNNLSAAMGLYEKVVLNYPGSLYSVEAGKKFRLLRQKLNGNP